MSDIDSDPRHLIMMHLDILKATIGRLKCVIIRHLHLDMLEMRGKGYTRYVLPF